ncbi:MAG: hypothetical protein ACXU8U_11510, partial [Asticcacaulis sp.]
LYIGFMILISSLMGLMWAYMALIARMTDPRLSTAFKWMVFVRMSVTPPLICGLSIWLSLRYSIWAGIGFIPIAFFIANRIRVPMYRVDSEGEEAA